MGEGSRWYFPVFEGLFSAEHCAAMGQSLWLYGWLVARAHVARSGGLVQYNHLTAATDLGKSERTIRLWFLSLQEHGYIDIRARHQYHLEVQVTKWRSVEEWLDARHSTPDGQLLAGLGQGGNQGGNQTGNENGKILPPSPIYITLPHYRIPTGSPGEPAASLASAFRGLLEHLKTAENKAATLRAIYVLCFGEADAPDYGYLGRAARSVGGAGRLAQLLWELTANPPTGDVLAYIMGAEKSRKARGGGRAGAKDNGHLDDPSVYEAAGKEWADGK